MIETSAKDFGRYPELLPVHIDRVLRANIAARGYMASGTLLTEGIVSVPDLLGADLAARVAEEVAVIRPGDAKRPDSLVTAAPQGSACRACAEAMWAWIGSLFRGHRAEAEKKFHAGLYRQHLFNAPDDNDIQKVFHFDTFFPAIKFWYFPQPVDEMDGPLMYVPRSPVLTDELLAWHGRQIESIAAGNVESWRGAGHREGSLRISEVEIAELGLRPKPVTVDGDTLVIANVFGFHRRGDTDRPTHRLSVHGSIRLSRPFEAGT